MTIKSKIRSGLGEYGWSPQRKWPYVRRLVKTKDVEQRYLGTGPFPGSVVGSSAAIPVSTVAPFHNSIGDISTALVTQNYLSAKGIPAYSTSFWDSRHETIVIGGGDIIGFPASGEWRSVKPLFLPPGRHVLNAVGFAMAGGRQELTRLQAYKYVSVRDLVTADIFREYCSEVFSVPCPATLQYSLPLGLIQSLPAYEFLQNLDAGKYIVVHRHPRLSRIARKLRNEGHTLVIVDMQAHAQHPWVAGDVVIPSTHSPEIIKGLVASASAVLTSSLHLAIFALSEGVPFSAVLDGTAQGAKVQRYLSRAGVVDAMGQENEDLLGIAMRMSSKISEVSKKEHKESVEHLDRMVRALSLGYKNSGSTYSNVP